MERPGQGLSARLTRRGSPASGVEHEGALLVASSDGVVLRATSELVGLLGWREAPEQLVGSPVERLHARLDDLAEPPGFAALAARLGEAREVCLGTALTLSGGGELLVDYVPVTAGGTAAHLWRFHPTNDAQPTEPLATGGPSTQRERAEPPRRHEPGTEPAPVADAADLLERVAVDLLVPLRSLHAAASDDDAATQPPAVAALGAASAIELVLTNLQALTGGANTPREPDAELDTVARACLERLRPIAAARNVALIVDLASRSSARCSATQAAALIENVLAWALDACAAGEAVVVTSARVDESTAALSVSCRTGAEELPPEVAARISTAPPAELRGLGAAVVRRLSREAGVEVVLAQDEHDQQEVLLEFPATEDRPSLQRPQWRGEPRDLSEGRVGSVDA